MFTSQRSTYLPNLLHDSRATSRDAVPCPHPACIRCESIHTVEPLCLPLLNSPASQDSSISSATPSTLNTCAHQRAYRSLAVSKPSERCPIYPSASRTFILQPIRANWITSSPAYTSNSSIVPSTSIPEHPATTNTSRVELTVSQLCLQKVMHPNIGRVCILTLIEFTSTSRVLSSHHVITRQFCCIRTKSE